MFDNKKRWFLRRYGSKRGFICTQWHRVLYFLGRYHRYRRISWHKVDRLIFVCKGNICRSAFAEVVAKSRGLDSVSCGVDTRDGAPAGKTAVDAALRKGKDLRLHRTQTIASISMREGDLYIAMEPWHAKSIEGKLGGNAYCTLLGLWGTPRSPYIHDPYGTMPSYFDHCFDQIEKSVSKITHEIHKAKAK